MPTTVWPWYKKRYTCSAFSTFEQAQAPTGKEWVHEIKYDGYRMHARIDRDQSSC
jgi:ATP-dependent DNA ligase